MSWKFDTGLQREVWVDEPSPYGRGPSSLAHMADFTKRFEALLLEDMMRKIYPIMVIKETPVSDAVKRADQVKQDIKQLEDALGIANDSTRRQRERAEGLEIENAKLRQQPITAQRALLVYRDGRTKNTVYTER